MTESSTTENDAENSNSDSLADSLPTALFGDKPIVTVPRPPCDACGTNHYDELIPIDLGDESFDVCEGCRNHLIDEVENYYWFDRLSEGQYNRAAEYLRSLDDIWCVKDHAAQGGELWVHTPICDAGIVHDVCEHFGFHIRWFSIATPGNGEFDCVEDHGPCLEINLDYNHRHNDPLPLEYDIEDDRTYSDVEFIDENTRLDFDEDEP